MMNLNQFPEEMSVVCQTYLADYLKSLPKFKAEQYSSFSADYFCADEVNANLCAELILLGEKRASCSMAHWYYQENEVYPQVGHLQVVTNWQGQPVCIIEITQVLECPFNQISAEFAAAEGEGDKSLGWWRAAHWDFFSKECNELGITPKHDMMLVLERFKAVYPELD
ncbi:ASCH domain-containing protein [Marinomonas sp. THO17]|uniref:ASCH domain-containing protein n=1 Tax=Marinomonas sp. THO17 TaxID=3149048 RepID=UPI00336BB220